MKDICEYTEWMPSQFVLFTESFEPENLPQVTAQLGSKFTMINEEEIQKLNLELIIKNMPEEDESQKKKNKKDQTPDYESQPPRYDEAFESFLGDKKYSNFVVVCSQKLKEYLYESYFFNGIT